MEAEYRKWVIPYIGRAFVVVYRYKNGVVQILLVKHYLKLEFIL